MVLAQFVLATPIVTAFVHRAGETALGRCGGARMVDGASRLRPVPHLLAVERIPVLVAIAYTLSDRGTWLSFGNKGGLAVLVEGDPRLPNRYDVILLDPKKHPEAKQEAARRLAEWLISPQGQDAINGFKIDGEQLFHPLAGSPK